MYSYNQFSRVWFLTWTCYGQWLPGDSRGFVSNKFEGDVTEKRNNIVRTPYDQGRPELWKMARRNLVGEPVTLTAEQAEEVWEQFTETAAIRHWTLITCAIMYNHVHLMVGVPGDPNPEDILRDLVIAFRALPGLEWFSVSCENFESIHNHNAYASHEEQVV